MFVHLLLVRSLDGNGIIVHVTGARNETLLVQEIAIGIVDSVPKPVQGIGTVLEGGSDITAATLRACDPEPGTVLGHCACEGVALVPGRLGVLDVDQISLAPKVCSSWHPQEKAEADAAMYTTEATAIEMNFIFVGR